MAATKKRTTVMKSADLERTETYPFTTLAVGGTFVVEVLEKWNSIRSSASRKGKKLGRTFEVKRIKHNRKDAIQVTRTA